MNKGGRSVSDSSLQKKFRAAVAKMWNYSCAFKGLHNHICSGDKEAHHVRRRAVKVLTYDPMNGAYLCGQAHRDVTSGGEGEGATVWRRRLDCILGEKRVEYLDIAERFLLPEFLQAHKYTRNDWLLECNHRLDDILKGD